MFPSRRETAAVESLCFPVVVPTRPQGGCDPVLPLPMCWRRNDQEVIVSRRESKVAESDVSRDICLEPDLLLIVEPLAVPKVALTRSRVEGPLVVARPVDVIFPDVRCQSLHFYGTGLPSGCDDHGSRGASGRLCGRSDETTGWPGSGRASAGG